MQTSKHRYCFPKKTQSGGQPHSFFQTPKQPHKKYTKLSPAGGQLTGVIQTLTQKFIQSDSRFYEKKNRGREPAGQIYL
jgi:hypothetical protein